MTSARPHRPGILLVAAVALAALVAGCGGGSSSAGSTTTVTVTRTATTPAVGGTATVDGIVTGVATCDTASIGKAVAAAGKAEKTNAVLAPDGLRCAKGWAAAAVDVGTGDNAVTETMVFQAEGQFWVPQDRTNVCPKPSPVPAAIYQIACESN